MKDNVKLISKFADDTKVGCIVDTENDVKNMQYVLDKVVEWADLWQMQYNGDKCKVLYFGRQNTDMMNLLVLKLSMITSNRSMETFQEI